MLLRSNDKNRSNPGTLATPIFYESGPKIYYSAGNGSMISDGEGDVVGADGELTIEHRL